MFLDFLDRGVVSEGRGGGRGGAFNSRSGPVKRHISILKDVAGFEEVVMIPCPTLKLLVVQFQVVVLKAMSWFLQPMMMVLVLDFSSVCWSGGKHQIFL